MTDLPAGPSPEDNRADTPRGNDQSFTSRRRRDRGESQAAAESDRSLPLMRWFGQSKRARRPETDPVSRVDLHLHSRASTDTGSWFLQAGVTLPESYTDPAVAYARAMERGMHFFTLSDHNTIDGALEVAHHDNAFISVEATVEFPEDKTPCHILVWGIDEALWDDMNRLRDDVYAFTAFLAGRDIPYALAHPLHRVGGSFTQYHLERSLLLFPLWEGRNGARPKDGNEVGCRMAAAGTPEFISKLADKHGIEPLNHGPPGLVAGSDDHGLFDVASTWTEFPPSSSCDEILDHLRGRRTVLAGSHGATQKMAHSVASLFFKAWSEHRPIPMPERLRDVVGDLINHPLAPAPEAVGGGNASDIGHEIMGRLKADRRFRKRFSRLGKELSGAERGHARLVETTNWLHEQLISAAVERSGKKRGFGARVECFAGGAALAIPYIVASGYLQAESRFALDAEREFFGGSVGQRGARAAMFTDTFDEINGVAGTMRRIAAHGDERLTVFCSGDPEHSAEGEVRVHPIQTVPLPAYGDGDWRLGVPSLIRMLEEVEKREIDVFHAATPGPMGIAALILARAMGKPFIASYHTELGRYALDLTGDRLAAMIASHSVDWFYGQAERIYVPSATTGGALSERTGIGESRIHPFSRGIDTELFAPEKRGPSGRRSLGAAPSETVLLYVGRISREKGVHLLAAAFKDAARTRPDLKLVCVGDGPAHDDLATSLAGTNHHFTGTLRGEDLAAAYASADIFCLPSETETFGQVISEASASGLPTVVVDRGAAQESVVDGETGLVAASGEVEPLTAAISRLADDPELRSRMGSEGRELALAKPTWSEIFDRLIESYDDLDGQAGETPAALPV